MSGQLRLNRVHGYRGHQCRSNAFITSSGSCIYFVAGLGIVADNDSNQQFYYGHTDDIISLHLHEDEKTVASGQVGTEPMICVWSSQTMDTIAILKGGHKLGISSVRFGAGIQAKYLVSCGLEKEHNIIVWDWAKGRSIASVRGDPQRVFDAQLSPFSPKQLVSCGVDHIKFWTLSGNTLTTKTGTSDGANGSVETQLCLAFDLSSPASSSTAPEEQQQRMYSCTQSGRVILWNAATHTMLQQFQCHQGPIFSIHGIEHGLATGGMDGMLRLWEPDMSLIAEVDVSKLTNQRTVNIRSVFWAGDQVLVGTKHSQLFLVNGGDKEHPVTVTQGHAPGELWGLAASPKGDTFVTASDDGNVALWGWSNEAYLRFTMLPCPLRSCAFSTLKENPLDIAVGSRDGRLFVLDESIANVLHEKKLRDASLDCVVYSANNLLLCGFSDGFLHVLEPAKGYSQVASARVCESFISHINLLEDDGLCLVTTGDGSLLYVRIATAGVLPSADHEHLALSSYGTPVLPSLKGVWGHYSDANDINVAAVSSNMVVTGDDYGNVKVYDYPCTSADSKHRTYKGHSAHVTNMAFDASNEWLVSTGGADHAVFLWKVFPQGGALDDPQYDSEDVDTDYEDCDGTSVDSDVEGETQLTYARKELPPPSSLEPKATKTTRQPPPLHSARLGRVHGYRGYDCRNNMYYDSSLDVLVYHIAAVGIVLDIKTQEQHFYIGHSDDILCLAEHQEDDLVATGQVGKSAEIHVWGLNTRETLSILKGFHTRGVCALDFHPDGKRLVSVGLDNDHSICLWDWQKGVQMATTRGHKDKIFAIAFNPVTPSDIVTVGVKHIKFWTKKGNSFTGKRGIFGKKGNLETQLCVAFNSAGNALTGSTSGIINVWDKHTLVKTVQAHKGSIFALFALDQALLSGGKDGVIRLFADGLEKVVCEYPLTQEHAAGKMRREHPTVRALVADSGKIFAGTKDGDVLFVDQNGAISVLEQGHGEGEMWGLGVHPTEQLFATTSDDKSLRIWELEPACEKPSDPKCACLAILPLKHASRSVAFGADGKVVAVGFLNGIVEVYSYPISAQSAPMHTFHHRKENISDIKFSPDGKYFAVSSHDNFVDIYSTETWKRVGVGKGPSSYVTHLDWDTSSKLIRTNSGAKEELFFRAPKGQRQVVASSALEAIEWQTMTCVLGKDIIGIWPSGSDVTDVNACCLSSDGKVLATADDFGFVKLFDFPSKTAHAKHKSYMGHSAHVTNIRFSHNDKYLISVGGGDASICIWDFGAGVVDDTRALPGDGSDTDSEEEGYDSDVVRERRIDYSTKTYTHNSSERAHAGAKLMQRNKRSAGAKGRKSAPSKRPQQVKNLELDFIHGYRGYDARNNLKFIDKDTIVYHAAGACIVMNTRTRKQTFYLQHTDDVICLTTNPKKSHYIATGQIGDDPTIHVWSAKTMETLSILSHSHKVGIGSLSFSANGKVLVSIGVREQPEICVYRWQTGITLATATENHRLFVVAFRPGSDVEFVTAGIKHLKFWTLTGSSLLSTRGNTSGAVQKKMTTQLGVGFGPEHTSSGKGADAHGGVGAHSGLTFSCAMNGEIWVWRKAVLVACIAAHSRPSFAMSTETMRDGSVVIVTGGKDGYVRSWDVVDEGQGFLKLKSEILIEGEELRSVCKGSNNRYLVGTENSAIYLATPSSTPTLISCGHGEGELWGLASAHAPDAAFDYVSVSEDKTLRLWKTSPHELVGTPVALQDAARCVALSGDDKLACVGAENGALAIYNVGKLCSAGTDKDSAPVAVKRDRGSAIRALAISGTQHLIAVGSAEKAIDLYEFPGLTRTVYCSGLPSVPTHIAWSKDSSMIKVETETAEVLYFNAQDARQLPTAPDNVSWTLGCGVLDASVAGIWSSTPKKEHVLCCAKSAKNGVCVTGDTLGKVKLFPYPCAAQKPKHSTYVGHAASVTNVQFVHDEQFVVSTGGDDNSVLVWKAVQSS